MTEITPKKYPYPESTVTLHDGTDISRIIAKKIFADLADAYEAFPAEVLTLLKFIKATDSISDEGVANILLAPQQSDKNPLRMENIFDLMWRFNLITVTELKPKDITIVDGAQLNEDCDKFFIIIPKNVAHILNNMFDIGEKDVSIKLRSPSAELKMEENECSLSLG